MPSTNIIARPASRRLRGVGGQVAPENPTFSDHGTIHLSYFCCKERFLGHVDALIDGVRWLVYLLRFRHARCLQLGTVWTELPVGAGRVRTAAFVLHTGSCEAPLHFQPDLPSVVGFAGASAFIRPRFTHEQMFGLQVPNKPMMIDKYFLFSSALF